MKKSKSPLFTTILLLLIGVYTNAQDVNLEWVKQMGGDEDDFGEAIALDDLGNVYTTGVFRETVDFDPGAGVLNLTSNGGPDIYIQKLDEAGDLVWVKQIGGIDLDNSYSIVLDDLGNVYTTGVFRETVDFDPGAGVLNLSSNGEYDIYIQKLDESGDLVWAKQIGGEGDDGGVAIALDDMGNVYAIGLFSSTVDFDPGVGVLNLTSNGGRDMFIQKLDESGDLVWAKQIGGEDDDYGEAIAVDDLSNIYIIGSFGETVDFDPGVGTHNLTSNGSVDIFIQKLNASGDFVWAKQTGGVGFDLGRAIAVDDFGNIYIKGAFSEMVDFDPGVGTHNLTSNGSADIFIQKLNASGDLIWAKQMGGSGFDVGVSITVDASGNVLTTGYFGETVDFDPGVGMVNLTSNGSADIYIQKLDESGDLVWIKQIGGAGNDFGEAIALDDFGNIYLAGVCTQTVDFDPESGTLSLTSNGADDIYIVKLRDLLFTSNNELETSLGILVYPNPTSNLLEIDKGINSEIKIQFFDNLGQVIISEIINNQITSIDLSNYSSGIYFLSINNGKNTTTQKIIKL